MSCHGVSSLIFLLLQTFSILVQSRFIFSHLLCFFSEDRQNSAAFSPRKNSTTTSERVSLEL